MPWWGPDERGRVAKSLRVLYDQIDQAFPGRKRSNDGTIGDEAHQATKSEHNPDENGVVRALDITHDPAHGVDARRIAEQLVASRDSRILYIISNRQMVRSYPRTGTTPWQWAPYTGGNPHTEHMHVSVVDVPNVYDHTRQWKIGFGDIMAPRAGRFTSIKATVFNDVQLAYGAKPEGFLGYSLPGRINGELDIRVTNRANGKSVVLKKADIGPWYDGREGWPEDRWWETGKRPRAEVDSRTNGAGMDLLPAAARAIGIEVVERNGQIVAGEAQVDVELIGVGGEEPRMTDMEKLLGAVEALTRQVAALTQIVTGVAGAAGQKPVKVEPPKEPVETPKVVVPVVPVADPNTMARSADLRTGILSALAALLGPATGMIDTVDKGTLGSLLPYIGVGVSALGGPGMLIPWFLKIGKKLFA